MSWSNADLTAIAGGPDIVGGVVGYATSLPGEGPAARVLYTGETDPNRHIHELSKVGGGNWTHTDLIAVAGLPPDALVLAGFIPYVTNLAGEGPTARVLFRLDDLHIHELSMGGFGSWTHTNLTAIAHAPPGSDVMGYTTNLAGEGPAARVLYRNLAPDQPFEHIHELSKVGGGNWTHTDLTEVSGKALAGGPIPGSAMGYTTNLAPRGPNARVVFKGHDAHIHELSQEGGGNWAYADLTAIAGAPDAIEEVMGAYATNLGGQGPAARVLYLGADHHVHELSSVSDGEWSHTDLTAITSGPLPTVSDVKPVTSYATCLNGQGPAARVLYRRDETQHIHELSKVGGGSWQHTDLTAVAGATDAMGGADSYMGYVTSLGGQGPAARVVYVGFDHHIHELSTVG
jgi:hypothetical protein